jgi:small-conductance mechanosensitive channel
VKTATQPGPAAELTAAKQALAEVTAEIEAGQARLSKLARRNGTRPTANARQETIALRASLDELRRERDELTERVGLLDTLASRHSALRDHISRAERTLAGCDALDAIGDRLAEIRQSLAQYPTLPVAGDTVRRLRWVAERWPWSVAQQVTSTRAATTRDLASFLDQRVSLTIDSVRQLEPADPDEMRSYRVLRDYRSGGEPDGIELKALQVVDLPRALADWINRDSANTLAEVS